MFKFRGLCLLLLWGQLLSCSQTAQSPSSSAPPVPADASAAPLPRAQSTTLKLLYGRTPTTLNPHLANGIQDFEAARIVYEPLASYSAAGELVPILAAEIPTLDNQGLAADGRSLTWKLRPDVVWSDGTPFTAADVVFTYKLVSAAAVAAVTADYYEQIETVEAVDDTTVKITFKQPTPAWDLPFVGQNGLILPAHRFANIPLEQLRSAPANLSPVGTGAYRFVGEANGTWVYAPNPNYRTNPQNAAPAFERIELQTQSPRAAARAVLQTGAADFAHNLQLEAAQLESLAKNEAGQLVTVFGSQVERLMFNFSDPNTADEAGERASRKVAHPILSDRAVRQAINLAIDRDALTQQLYGSFGKPTGQLLVAPPRYAADSIATPFDPEQAKALLDEAGWTDSNGNGTRDKNGVEMELQFQTSVNPVRQQTQQMIEQNLADIDIAVTRDRIPADEFFSADPKQTRSINHFYADLQAYAIGNDVPDPTVYLSWWTCDRIASRANQWQEPNNARYCSPTYDSLWQAATQALDPDQRTILFQQMDELLAQDVAVLPLVHRAMIHGVSQRLTGYDPTPWDASTWDIANWRIQTAARQED